MTGRLILLNAVVIASLVPVPVGAAWQAAAGPDDVSFGD